MIFGWLFFSGLLRWSKDCFEICHLRSDLFERRAGCFTYVCLFTAGLMQLCVMFVQKLAARTKRQLPDL